MYLRMLPEDEPDLVQLDSVAMELHLIIRAA